MLYNKSFIADKGMNLDKEQDISELLKNIVSYILSSRVHTCNIITSFTDKHG